MATRQSMDDLLQKCEDAIHLAQFQYSQAGKQEHYNDFEFTTSMQSLEAAYNELEHMTHSANAQQREQLHRMRLQLQQVQNDMTLLEH